MTDSVLILCRNFSFINFGNKIFEEFSEIFNTNRGLCPIHEKVSREVALSMISGYWFFSRMVNDDLSFISIAW